MGTAHQNNVTVLWTSTVLFRLFENQKCHVTTLLKVKITRNDDDDRGFSYLFMDLFLLDAPKCKGLSEFLYYSKVCYFNTIGFLHKIKTSKTWLGC